MYYVLAALSFSCNKLSATIKPSMNVLCPLTILSNTSIRNLFDTKFVRYEFCSIPHLFPTYGICSNWNLLDTESVRYYQSQMTKHLRHKTMDA